MKKALTLLSLFALVILSSSSYVLQHKNGEAGKTGSPNEQTCAGGGCHSGGSSPLFGVTISSSPAFTLNQFVPGTLYSMSVTVSATNFNHFGFGCEILNSINANAGNMQTQGPGVQFAFFVGRKNATHTVPKAGTNNEATFTFEWLAPITDTSATIYVCGNAVNLNNLTSGDKPIPTSLYLRAYQEEDSTAGVGIKEIKQYSNIKFSVSPNPAKELLQLGFEVTQTGKMEVILCDLKGAIIKQMFNDQVTQGYFSKFLDIRNVPAGVYFLKLNSPGNKPSQKMVVIE